MNYIQEYIDFNNFEKVDEIGIPINEKTFYDIEKGDKIHCFKDGYMNNGRQQFCEINNSYIIINGYNRRGWITIRDHRNYPHNMGFDFVQKYFDYIIKN